MVSSADSSFNVARLVVLLEFGATKKDLIDYHVELECLPLWPSSLLGLPLAASDLFYSSTI
jgi:hypothetical protein